MSIEECTNYIGCDRWNMVPDYDSGNTIYKGMAFALQPP
jgi:hypothetical protein